MRYKEFGSNSLIYLLGLFVYGLVLILNDGFMALDEYWVGIIRYIPAQTSSLMSLVGPDDVKSPLQLLPMHVLSQLSLKLGIESPYWQYRFVLTVLGLLSVGLIFFSFRKFSKIANLQPSQEKLLFLLLIFYFAAPFSLTRPMFESVAAPWLTLAAVYAYSYDQYKKMSDLLLGVGAVSVSFVLRQQLGSCALVFIILPILHKNWRHLIYASIAGLLFFILSGVPDIFIRGQFHFSLLQLTVYNYQHGAEYGQQGVWFYPALIFVLFFIPFFIKKYPPGFIHEQIRKYRSFYTVLFLFILLHSLFPNKWERFLISIVPLMLLTLFPYLNYLQMNFNKHKWRLWFLYGINIILFLVASFFPAQKNLIEMSRYLSQHPEIKEIYRVQNTPEWITEAFILNKQFSFIESDISQLSVKNWTDCESVFVVGEAQAEQYKGITDRLVLNATFNVNLIEQLSFKLNPTKNLRRVQLKLYSGCQK